MENKEPKFWTILKTPPKVGPLTWEDKYSELMSKAIEKAIRKEIKETKRRENNLEEPEFSTWIDMNISKLKILLGRQVKKNESR